jgi:hypothetical protein
MKVNVISATVCLTDIVDTNPFFQGFDMVLKTTITMRVGQDQVIRWKHETEHYEEEK